MTKYNLLAECISILHTVSGLPESWVCWQVPDGWKEVPVSIADLGGTEVNLFLLVKRLCKVGSRPYKC